MVKISTLDKRLLIFYYSIMNDLTERQKTLLEIIIQEHIENASPISSKFIENEYDLGVSPATIRAEMYELIEKGYLFQPHTSSGRMPTDKGYRFFVNTLSEKEIEKMEWRLIRKVRKMKKEIAVRSLFMREFTRFLAETSSSLTVSYFPQDNILLKEGWGEVLKDPEFNNVQKVHGFLEMVNDFEKNIDNFLEPQKLDCMRVYIGSEAPFSEKEDFSILISPCQIKKKDGCIAIIGPKRMPYEKNISLFDSIIKLLEE